MSENKMQPVRGTKDLFGQEIEIFNHIVTTAKNASFNYGFKELETPIFEFSEVFERNLGESSDIISKEVYKFPDRGDNFLTLRPEFTAGIVRAFISNGELQQVLPQKFFSAGPIFRYDRPQKGRQRQFHQINFEMISAANFLYDVEAISLAAQILKELGILNKTVLQINSLGCEKTIKNYESALVTYFTKYKNDLSEDSKNRLEKNPLRILDSKNEGDIKLVQNAPEINAFYEAETKDNFNNILKSLDNLGIKYQVNSRLVRGLDYYTGVVFEFVTSDLGAQNTVLAGGRYDKLIGNMGGPEAAAIGFAAGIERLMLLSELQIKKPKAISVIFVDEKQQDFAFKIADDLRSAGIYIEIYFGGNMKKQMKRAGQIDSKFAIIIGEDEVKTGKVSVKNFEDGKEEKIAADKIIEYFK